jgi:hypothetical protein
LLLKRDLYFEESAELWLKETTDMYQAMLIGTFGVGVVLVLAALIAFFKGKAGGGNIQISFGSTARLEAKGALLSLAGLGAFLILIAIYSENVVAMKDDKIERKDNQVRDSTAVAAAFTKFPFNPVSTQTGRNTLGSVELARYRNLQSQAFGSFRDLATDRDLALFLLGALSKNTFGLVAVPPGNVNNFEGLLVQISKQFSGDHKIEIELAKGYRSLYESSNNPKYLEEFHRLALAATRADEPNERFAANQLVGLALQREEKHGEALKYLTEAEKTVPDRERYKLDFNFCNVLTSLKLYKEALNRCRDAEMHAEAQQKHFWQPLFMEGLIAFQQKDQRTAAAAFVKSHKTASSDSEVELLTNYLKSRKELRALCTQAEFLRTYAEFCANGTGNLPRTGPM